MSRAESQSQSILVKALGLLKFSHLSCFFLNLLAKSAWFVDLYNLVLRNLTQRIKILLCESVQKLLFLSDLKQVLKMLVHALIQEPQFLPLIPIKLKDKPHLKHRFNAHPL